MPRKKKPGRKREKPVDGWVYYTSYERCEDCELRGALSITGKPVRDRDPHHKKLRRQGLEHLIPPEAHNVDGCENCGGKGYVKRRKSGDQVLNREWQ